MENYKELYNAADALPAMKAAKAFINKEYHLVTHTDADGYGCRFMLEEGSVPILDVTHVDYTDADKIISELLVNDNNIDRILFTDFSISQKVITLLEDRGIEWFCIDHHKSTMKMAAKYPNNFLLDMTLCATELCYVTIGMPEDMLKVANLIGVGDLFRDEDPRFWESRELTVGMKAAYFTVNHCLNKQEANTFAYRSFSAVVLITAAKELKPHYIQKCYADILHTMLELKVGEERTTKSVAMLVLELEVKAAIEVGVRVGSTLYVDDRFRDNFSSLSKKVFDNDTSLKLLVKLGVSGSISARGSKYHPEEVMELNNGEFIIEGHGNAGGGFHKDLATPLRNDAALTKAASYFKEIE